MEFLAKNFKDISDIFINNANLSKLDLYISGAGYLEEGVSCFTEITIKGKIQEIAEELEISDSKKEKKRQTSLRKEKKDAQAATRLSASGFRGSSTAMLMSDLSALFPSAGSDVLVLDLSTPFVSAGPVPGLSALSASAGSVMPMSCLFTPSASAGSAVPIPCLCALFVSALFASAPSADTRFAILVPGLSALSTSALSVSSGSALPILVLSTSIAAMLALSTFSTSIVTPISGRQKLIKLNQREKRATSEELAPAFTPLLPAKLLLSFPASRIGKKRLFNKAFDINYWPLTKDQFGEDVDLSFAGCQYYSAIKANRTEQ